MHSVTTIIVEARTLLREGLVSLLRNSGFKVIAAVPTLDKVPRVAFGRASLLTIGDPTETAEALDYLNKTSPAARNVKIVVITETAGNASQPDTLKVLNSGADCYVVNVRSRDILLQSLHLAALGQWVAVVGDYGVLDAFEVERDSSGFSEHEPGLNGMACKPRKRGARSTLVGPRAASFEVPRHR